MTKDEMIDEIENAYMRAYLVTVYKLSEDEAQSRIDSVRQFIDWNNNDFRASRLYNLWKDGASSLQETHLALLN